jgi:hypothetical protein
MESSWVLCKYSSSKSVRAVSDPESHAENGNTTNQFGALLGGFEISQSERKKH